MSESLMHDRGRGPEIRGTRITVYNLLAEFKSEDVTEGQLCETYRLTPQQVAAARAYVFNHFAEVMAGDAAIDERHRRAREAQETPEFLERVRQSHRRFLLFKQFLEEERARNGGPLSQTENDRQERYQRFRTWANEQENELVAEEIA